MCLAVPAKILEINELVARVDVGGNVREASIALLEDVSVGDYVLLHAGFAIGKYEEEEAKRTLALLREAIRASEGA